jgi:hypothetical protein
LTLISTIIRDAYREGNLIAKTAEPTTADYEEGLHLLNQNIASVYGIEVGEEYRPILIGRNNISRPSGYPWYETVPDSTDWYVPANVRLVLNLQEPCTVYLDPNPRDGARFAVLDKSNNLSTYNLTVNGNGRTISGATSVVVSTNGAAREYTYRGDTGDWALVSPLELDDDFPFPTAFEAYFSIGLTIRLDPRYEIGISPSSAAVFSKGEKNFKARYRQSEEQSSEDAYLFTPGVRRRYYGDTRLGNDSFNIGRPINRRGW